MKAWSIYVGLVVVFALGYLMFGPGGASDSAPIPSRGTPEPTARYWTSPGVEPDTCVSAWLLTRFVSPGATVYIVKRAKDVDPAAQAAGIGGIPFDVAGCQLQRRPGFSTTDAVIQAYAINDAFALRVGAVIHEVELAPWTTSDEPFFVRVRAGLAEAVNSSDDDEACLHAAMDFLDQLRREMESAQPAPKGT